VCFLISQFLRGAIGALPIVFALVAPAAAEERDAPEPPPTAAEPAPSETVYRYDAAIVGVDEEKLLELLTRSSQLIALADRPTATIAGLRRRIEGDQDRLDTVLRAEGYYAASVEAAVDPAATPAKVTLTVAPGPRYVVGSFHLAAVEGSADTLSEFDDGILGIGSGDAARAEDIVDAEKRVLTRLRDGALPFARFGWLDIKGLERTEDAYVRGRVPWAYREPFDQSKVDGYRADLLASGLFSSVTIDHAEAVDANGELPITVQVVEADARTIGAGIRYSSSEGPGGSVFWEHRNIFGRNEDVRIELDIAAITQSLGTTFSKPDFRLRGQELVTGITLTRTDSEAFEELGVSGSIGIRWPVNETWRGSIGTTVEYVDLEDGEGDQRSAIVGVPLSYSHDGSDSVLDPTRGTRLRLALTPFVATEEQLATFLVATVGGSGYVPLDEARRFVLAGRARVGSIAGERTDVVPANKRFYSGGGGSIRGYEFQLVGPLDAENDPVGGRSLLEVGAELRVRLFGDIGVVPFVEGGNVTDGILPDLDDDLQWAAGLGFRYHTAVGPLCLDVGFPLNRRVGVDDRWQFYLSLGQASDGRPAGAENRCGGRHRGPRDHRPCGHRRQRRLRYRRGTPCPR